MPASIIDDSIKNEDFIIQGVVDLIVLHNDEIWILDYKTGKLKLYNVFDDVGYRLDVEEIMKQKYDKKQFLYKLDCTAWFHFGAKVDMYGMKQEKRLKVNYSLHNV